MEAFLMDASFVWASSSAWWGHMGRRAKIQNESTNDG